MNIGASAVSAVRESRACGRATRAVVAAAVMAAAVLGFGTPVQAEVFNPRTFTLANGLQVVVIENHRLPVVRQMLFYKVGSADDPPGKSGLAHYLEHLMFQGTETLAPNEFSKIVARNGGRENAYTSHDTTAYYQTVARDRLDLVMRLEADRMANLKIDPAEAVPELQVVLEERRARTDNRPAAQLAEQMQAALFLNCTYRIPVIGWEHEIRSLTVGDAAAFYKRYYAPNNAILVISGDVTVDEVRPLAEKYYGVIPRSAEPVRRTRLEEPPQRAARRVTLAHPRVREPRWSREYLAPSHAAGETRHAHALEVLSVILGGGATSRLYAALVRDGKLALSVDTYYDGDMLGPAAFGISARPAEGVDLARLEAAIEDELSRLLRDGVDGEEVMYAKTRLLASAVYARSSLRRGASAIGTALTSGQDIAAVETWPERIRAVTAADVEAAARHVLRTERSVTGLLLRKTQTAVTGDGAAEETGGGPVSGNDGK